MCVRMYVSLLVSSLRVCMNRSEQRWNRRNRKKPDPLHLVHRICLLGDTGFIRPEAVVVCLLVHIIASHFIASHCVGQPLLVVIPKWPTITIEMMRASKRDGNQLSCELDREFMLTKRKTACRLSPRSDMKEISWDRTVLFANAI